MDTIENVICRVLVMAHVRMCAFCCVFLVCALHFRVLGLVGFVVFIVSMRCRVCFDFSWFCACLFAQAFVSCRCLCVWFVLFGMCFVFGFVV